MKRVFFKKVAFKMKNTYLSDDPSKTYPAPFHCKLKLQKQRHPMWQIYSISDSMKKWNDRKFHFYLDIQDDCPHASKTPVEDELMCDCMEEEREMMHV